MVLKCQEGKFEFIELKINTNNPLFAAIEIITYGLLYHFTKNHLSDLGYSNSNKEILEASSIHLKVLAPLDYYVAYDLKWLEAMLDKGLADFLFTKKWNMDFKFESLPKTITTTTKKTDPKQALAAINERSFLYP